MSITQGLSGKSSTQYTKRQAVASLVFGLVALVTFWVPGIGFVTGLLSIILGAAGLATAKYASHRRLIYGGIAASILSAFLAVLLLFSIFGGNHGSKSDSTAPNTAQSYDSETKAPRTGVDDLGNTFIAYTNLGPDSPEGQRFLPAFKQKYPRLAGTVKDKLLLKSGTFICKEIDYKKRHNLPDMSKKEIENFISARTGWQGNGERHATNREALGIARLATKHICPMYSYMTK